MISRPPLPTRADAGRFLICGLIGISAYNGLLNEGERTVSAGAAAFIVNVAPILTAILATVFLRERFSAWGWGGALISFAGVGLIALGQPGGLAFGGGASLVAGAALCTASLFRFAAPARPALRRARLHRLHAARRGAVPAPFLPGALPHLARARRRARRRRRWSRSASFPRRSATRPGPTRSVGSARRAPPISSTSCRRSRRWSALPRSARAMSALTLVGGAIAILGVVIVNSRGR